MFVDTQFQGRARFSGRSRRGPRIFWGTHSSARPPSAERSFMDLRDSWKRNFIVRFASPTRGLKNGTNFCKRKLIGKNTRYSDRSFNRVAFQSAAYFNRVYFKETVSFRGTKFLGLVEFRGTTLLPVMVFLQNAKFEDYASFENAIFSARKGRCDVDFTSIRASQPFKLLGAKFHEVPAFNQADIKKLLDFGCDFPLPSFWGGEEDLISRYRHIRRLAKDYDHETEQKAFHGELRSRRGNIDSKFGLSFWYDLFAACGRSIWQPFFWWVATLLFFAEIYLWNAGIGIANWRLMCWANRSTVGLKALSLSIANAVPVIGSSRPEEIRSIYACLYGVSGSHPREPAI